MDLAYRYEALNRQGHSVSGLVYSGCQDDAVYQVRSALRLEPRLVRFDLTETLAQFLGRKEPTRDMIRLYRTIAERKRIGRAIPQGLQEAIGYVDDKRLSSALQVMRQAMFDGIKFADAMQKAGLPETDVQAVRAVQAAGKEAEVLAGLADRMEMLVKLRQRIVAVVWYPIAVVVAMWVVAWAITLFIAPKLAEFFNRLSTLDVNLPVFAKAYYGVAGLLRDNALIGSLLWFALPVGVYLLVRSKFIARQLDRVPALHELSMKADLVSIFASLALLLSAGVKPVEAFVSVARAARRDDNRERLLEMTGIYRSGNVSLGRAIRVPQVCASRGECRRIGQQYHPGLTQPGRANAPGP
jgi:type II secretory pathway component PulF